MPTNQDNRHHNNGNKDSQKQKQKGNGGEKGWGGLFEGQILSPVGFCERGQGLNFKQSGRLKGSGEAEGFRIKSHCFKKTGTDG